MRMPKSAVAAAVSLAVTACGGGGSGVLITQDRQPVSTSNSQTAATSTLAQAPGDAAVAQSTAGSLKDVPYHTPVPGGAFANFAGPSDKHAVQDIFARDLNRDSIDEVVIAGRMTQSTPIAEWQSYNLQIFGWNTGAWSRETQTWFQGQDNQILGTEPAVRFGDFNGDGHIDMLAAPSTDMQHHGPAVVYFNSGHSSLTRTNVDIGSAWAHDAVVADFDGDGFSDFMVADLNGRPSLALGSATGTFTVIPSRGVGMQWGGSGISVADYLGDGTNTIVITDAPATGNQDTKLYAWSITNGELDLTELAALPASRFYLPKWSAQLAAASGAPHDIRNIAMDFNRDGRMDVIVFSTLPDGVSAYHGHSEVQFLRNDGAGQFTDVTDSVLADFNTNTYQTYQPVIMDVNQDGLDDILMTSADYTGAVDSNRVLLQTLDGKFTESYGSVFDSLYAQTQASTAGAYAANQAFNIVRGPAGDLYFVTTVQFLDAGETKTQTYAARIGSNGTTSVQATLATINRIWPYLSQGAVNEVLARSSFDSINGIPVIDYQAAMTPVGQLRMGTPQRQVISGGIAFPGFNSTVLQGLQAFDDVGRNFVVDLSVLTGKQVKPAMITNLLPQDVTQNWSQRLVRSQQYDNGVMSVSADHNNFSTSVTNRALAHNQDWIHRIGFAQTQGSPWLTFSGVFGRVQHSRMIDYTVTRLWQDGQFWQAGVTQTATQFRTGLVRDVDPLWSAYAVTGWQHRDWSLYGGLQPTLFAGSVTLTLPTDVDSQGQVSYQHHRMQVRNQAQAFAGFSRDWYQAQRSVNLSGTADQAGDYMLKLTVKQTW